MDACLRVCVFVVLFVSLLSWIVCCDQEDNVSDSDVVSKPDGDANLVWIRIPGGSFMMGSDEDRKKEIPLHEVIVPAFEMLKSEVTAAQFWQCYNDDDACSVSSESTGGDCSFGNTDNGNFPMTCINWRQSKAFCQWAGGRLPSEAEWEYAASNGDMENLFPWGDDGLDCEHAIIETNEGSACGKGRAWEACSKPKGNTTHGLCDMIGNVWEWVEDDKHQNYKGAPTDGSAWVDDPRADERMVRGASFGSWKGYLRVAHRNDRSPDYYGVSSGFRCAR